MARPGEVITPRKWVLVDFGVPTKEVLKVLVRTNEGLVYEGRYDRSTKQWKRTEDDSIIVGAKSWSLLEDSVATSRKF